MKGFKDAEHLFRLLLVFVVGVIVFVLLRVSLVPRSFGQYGHYRGDAIAEIAAHPAAFAGHQSCAGCHSDIVEQKLKGKHARVNCEACHGALLSHADDPGSVIPVKLEPAKLCVGCHEANAAKPKTFPQVISADHASGASCDLCHQPHNPAINSGAGNEDYAPSVAGSLARRGPRPGSTSWPALRRTLPTTSCRNTGGACWWT